MAKRKRNDDVLNQLHEDDDEQQLRPVFVDTNIDTNIIVLISPFSSFSVLKEQIVRQHANCFAELGEIKINALKVKREEKYYRLSESMLLKTAFHGVETWFVFADVDKTSLGQSPKAQSVLTNHEHVSNLQIPNDSSKDSESKAIERGSDIGSPGGQKGLKHKRRKKEKHCGEDLSLEALTSTPPAENVHKIKRNNAVDESLLDRNGLMSGFEGGPPETKQPVNKKDDLQKDDVDASTEGEARKKIIRYSQPDTAGHVHEESSVSTDAKGTSELPAQLEGSGKISGITVNQESVVQNAEAISELRVKKANKKNKGGGGDGVDKIHSANVDKGPDVMPKGVAAGKESDRINTTIEETPLKQTDDAELLLSQHEEVNKEDIPLISPELKKNTESRNASKKKRSSKAGCEPPAKKTKKTNKKDVDGVDGSPQVLKSSQYDVTALDSSEKAVCERESNSKITAEEKILETGSIAKKKKTYKNKETDLCLDALRQDVAEILQQADTSKPEQNPESANVTEGTKVEKSKPSKKTKKSKKNERVSEVLPQIVNDNSAAEPAKSSKHEENSELTSVNPKKKSKSKKTTPAVDVPENPVSEQVADGKMADNVLTNKSLSPIKLQTELNEVEQEHSNENAAQEVYSQETDKRNLVKQTKRSKRKKLDQPSSIDTSSNLMATEKGYESERTFPVSHQLQSDVHEAGLVKVIGVESVHPQLSTPEVNGETTIVKPKKKVQSKHSASETSSAVLHMKQQLDVDTQKTADDDDAITSLSANKKQTELNDGEHEPLNENSVQKVAHEATMTNPAKQAKNKSKRKKPDQPSSIDTSSNLMTVEKGYESERTSLVSHQLRSDVHETEPVKVTCVESFQPQVGTPVVNGEITNVRPKKKAQRKHSDSENNKSILHMKQQLEAKAQKTVEQGGDVTPNHIVNDSDCQEKVSLHEKCHDGSTEVRKPDNQPPSNTKEVQMKKNQETAFKTPSNKKNQESAFKTPSNKNLGLPVSSIPQKKQVLAISGGLFGGLYSDSSDDEVERNGSSCSTRTPDDLSSSDYSSDYSEGESKGDAVTSQQKSNGSQSAKEKTNLNLSAFKDQDIKSVLRNSRLFKDAKLAAAQSQLEEGESEPPEFVPDSLAD